MRNMFPIELLAYRQKRDQVSQALVVVIDGDNQGVAGRMQQLADYCRKCDIDMPQKGERVAIFVPTWNIEAWLVYLGGQDVNEGNANYPKLKRPRQCRQHVDVLAENCRRGELRKPAPDSLEKACREYDLRLR